MGHTQFNAGGFNVVADRCVSVELKQKTKEKQRNTKMKTSMLIWENNPLTFKFLVTSFGIAVSLYTSFSEIGLYTFNVFLTLLLFMGFFIFGFFFFCLLGSFF